MIIKMVWGKTKPWVTPKLIGNEEVTILTTALMKQLEKNLDISKKNGGNSNKRR